MLLALLPQHVTVTLTFQCILNHCAKILVVVYQVYHLALDDSVLRGRGSMPEMNRHLWVLSHTVVRMHGYTKVAQSLPDSWVQLFGWTVSLTG